MRSLVQWLSRHSLRHVAIKTSCAIFMEAATMLTGAARLHAADDDIAQLNALDARYQKALERNDARTMAAILADDFILVEGDGKRSTKADLLNDATGGRTHYLHQEDSERMVRVSGDTAVVTAKLWAKGVEDGVAVDYTLWFSDVYVRGPAGWRYYFGQASLPLPAAATR